VRRDDQVMISGCPRMCRIVVLWIADRRCIDVSIGNTSANIKGMLGSFPIPQIVSMSFPADNDLSNGLSVLQPHHRGTDAFSSLSTFTVRRSCELISTLRVCELMEV
jgi:hypothetical protein